MHGKFQVAGFKTKTIYVIVLLISSDYFFKTWLRAFLPLAAAKFRLLRKISGLSNKISHQVFLILYWTSLYSWSIFQYTTADCTRHYGITLNGFNLNLFTVYLNSIIVNWHCKYSVCLYYNWINQIVSIVNMYPSSWGQRYRMKISNDQIWSWQKEGLCKLNAPHKQDIQ